MKKTSIGILVSGVIFLGIFNLLFFMIGEMPHPASVWISYSSIHVSLVIALCVPLATSGKKDFARQSVVSFAVTGAYFALAFITALIFMIIAPSSGGGVKASWIIQVVLLAIFVIVFIPLLVANSSTNHVSTVQDKEAGYLQDAYSRVVLLRDSVGDAKTTVELDVLYNVIAASPTRSSNDVKDLEMKLISQISDLEDAADKKDYEAVRELCAKITRTVKERNRVLMLASR